ncbi:MAG: EscU/YscU/HrcU family type III secretion system export apparatus switch protein [Rubrivivax sp.]|jgi:flagellar biosynthetic protein FlhB|nr:flagellar type III secretion system protein FlhB [Rubrivivax sp.]
MAEQNAQDRNLPATQRKIDKAREDGQVARSRDLGHFVALGVAVAGLSLLAPQGIAYVRQLLQDGLRFDAATLAQPRGMGERLLEQSLQGLGLIVPIGVLMAVLALAAGLLSGGWNFTMKPLMPKAEPLNPLAGVKRLFGMQQMTQALKAILLASLLSAVGFAWLVHVWPQHLRLLGMALPTALAEAGGLVQGGLLLMAGVLAVFALVDVPLQRHLLLRRLRMTVQEMKQEFKEAEGNPEIKARRRGLMQQLAGKRMLAAVPTADLVVMNPTHYAVALKYEPGGVSAPRVVAKGADLLAMRIRDLAKEHRVPVLQAPPLARALYAHTELDQEIPARLFTAVAQVLAWVFQLREAAGTPQAARLAEPTPEVPEDMDPLSDRFVSARTAAAARREPEL